jgi:hypothetical protein
MPDPVHNSCSLIVTWWPKSMLAQVCMSDADCPYLALGRKLRAIALKQPSVVQPTSFRLSYNCATLKYTNFTRLLKHAVLLLLLLLLLLQEYSLEDHIRCVRQMGLSRTQQQQIADGFAVFSQLLEPVLQDMRQLQLQQPGENAAFQGSGGSSSVHNTQTADAGSGRAAVACGGVSHGSSAKSTAAAAAAAAANSPSLLSLEGYKIHRCWQD